jgi:hypothetical protein
MQNAKNPEYDEIWRAAQHRRTEDLTGWRSHSLKQSEKMPGADIAWPWPNLGSSLARGIAVAIIALVAITSVSVVVHAKKSSHVALRATAAMLAVNLP